MLNCLSKWNMPKILKKLLVKLLIIYVNSYHGSHLRGRSLFITDVLQFILDDIYEQRTKNPRSAGKS